MGREQDLIVWREWKRMPTPQNLDTVLKQLDPIIQTEVNRWSGTLARPLLEIEAKRLAAEAIHSYRPGGGAALATHVTNRLKKLSRQLYTHQDVARIPEYQRIKYNTFVSAQAKLEDKFGRPPTTNELTDELGWTRPYLQRFQKSIRREFLESGDPPPMFESTSDDSGLIDFVYNDMSPQDKLIFQHTTGYGGSSVLNNAQLRKKLKLTQGQLSYRKRKLIDDISAATGGGIR